MDGPAGQPTDNAANSDWLGVYDRTVPELMVQVFWQPRSAIWQRFSSDPDTHPKWRSSTVGNTRLNNCFHCWHCESGSPKDDFLHCSNGIPLQDLNRLYLRILNTVAYRDPDNRSLRNSQGQVYKPHKCSWGKFKCPYLCNHCLDNQFKSATFDLQRLKLLILFAGHTAMAYDKW